MIPPRKPVVTLPTDFFESGKIRALYMKKEGEPALILYLQLLCMATKQDQEGKLMLYGNIPLDVPTIARLTYKTEKEISASMKLLLDFQLLELNGDTYTVVACKPALKKKQPSEKKEHISVHTGAPIAPESGTPDWR